MELTINASITYPFGEDRHFCIRAAALGFTLYVDTHYPAYHIYRESDLHNAKLFLQATEEISSIPEVKLRQFEEHEVRAFEKSQLPQALPAISHPYDSTAK